jgi:WD40 repeat protein
MDAEAAPDMTRDLLEREFARLVQQYVKAHLGRDASSEELAARVYWEIRIAAERVREGVRDEASRKRAEKAAIWEEERKSLPWSEERVLEGHTGEVNSASFSPDGTRIVTTSGDHTARVWDAQTGAWLQTLTGHAGSVWSASFSPDGTRIVTASSDRTARVWRQGGTP